MWSTARRIVTLAVLLVAVSVSAASAQYSAPSAPSAPAAPSTPSAPSSAPPSMSVPGGTAAYPYPYTVDVAFAMTRNGEQVILTDAQGMSLYYLKNEISTATMCTGTCATVWPPALAPDGATFDPALTPLSIVNNANGPQFAYHGHLLYRYSKDTAPGQVNGDGVVDTWGSWAVAMPGMYWQP